MTKSTENPFVEIFKDSWEDFKQKYPSYQSEYYDTVVGKMLGCGDPAFGYIEYGCELRSFSWMPYDLTSA
jgi:hypothetical protein